MNSRVAFTPMGTVRVAGEIIPGMKVQASGDIEVGGTVDGAQLQAPVLHLQAHDLSNVGGQIVQTGSGNQAIALAGRLDNMGGTLRTAARNFSLQAQAIDNTGGQLLHAGDGMFHLVSEGGLDNGTGPTTRAATPRGAVIASAGMPAAGHRC